jgi:hypothetical protein
LNLAARGGYPKIVNFLLSKGANATTADNEGWTPAAWALSMGHIEVSQVIANHGNRLGNIGVAAPFSSPHVSPTTLLPLRAIQYKADRVIAAERYTKDVLARRAREQAARQETMRKKKERELLAMQEEAALRRKKELKRSYMRDAREQQSDPTARQPQQRGKFKKKVDLDASPAKEKESVAEEVAAQEAAEEAGAAAGAAEEEGEPAS